MLVVVPPATVLNNKVNQEILTPFGWDDLIPFSWATDRVSKPGLRILIDYEDGYYGPIVLL